MIDKERANAGKLMARLLRLLNGEGEGIRLAALRGGTKHNVIIPEAETVIATEMPGGEAGRPGDSLPHHGAGGVRTQ